MDSTPENKKLKLAGRILSVAVVLPFLASIFMILTSNPQVVDGMGKYGFSPSVLPVFAGLEILCVVAYAIPQTAVLGAILFTAYLGGAVCTHLRAGENIVLPIVFAVLIWGGIYLREPALRCILPLRKCCKAKDKAPQ